MTWTGTGTDSGHGRWESIDLAQNPDDSTLWTAVRELAARPDLPGHALPRAGRERRRLGRHGHRHRRRLLRRASAMSRLPTGALALLNGHPGLRLAAGHARQGDRRGRPGRHCPGAPSRSPSRATGELLSEYASVTSSDGTVSRACSTAPTPVGPPAGASRPLRPRRASSSTPQFTQVEHQGPVALDRPAVARHPRGHRLRRPDRDPAATTTAAGRGSAGARSRCRRSGAGATFPGGVDGGRRAHRCRRHGRPRRR